MSTTIFTSGPGGGPQPVDQAEVVAAGVVVALDSPAATEPEVTGAKASSLARAMQAGLPVLPGRVATTDAFRRPVDPDAAIPVDAELRAAWSAMSEGGTRPVVVRSSSTIEDGRTSSMAGMFTSVLDVSDWRSFRDAVDTVLESSKVVALADAGARERARAPMAVLVQPQLAPTVGGVLFGIDPVSGRTDHLVISASEAGPSAVVSGEVDGSRYVLSKRRHVGGDRRVRIVEGPGDDGPLTTDQLRRLSALSRQAARVFGGPQDVEWAFGPDGRLWLLQSRPVTAAAGPAPAGGPVLGPGPVAETFPEALSPLEEDLWVEPLRAGLRAALALAGTTPKRRLAASAVVATVRGRVAADLDLLGGGDEPKSVLRRLDPRPSLRRLVASWRVGRLRAALPALAGDLVAAVDRDLLAVGAVSGLSDRELLGLLERSYQGLTALHGHEVLLGWMVAPDASATTAASVALRALAEGRAQGLGDEEIVRRHPGVLALAAPRVGPTVTLPPTVDGLAPGVAPAPAPSEASDRAAVLREALRLRARWLQELTARAAWELGDRLRTRGLITDAEVVRALRLNEMADAVRAGILPADLAARGSQRASAPLPARFRLTADGAVAPVSASVRSRSRGRHRAAHDGRGTGAGGGRGMGPVHSGDGPPAPGAVLVVRTLDPGLAPLLPRLGGLVAETGSFLSHLAILAREFGVPTAVGVEGALSRFPAGAIVVVDGTTGEVGLVGERQAGAA